MINIIGKNWEATVTTPRSRISAYRGYYDITITIKLPRIRKVTLSWDPATKDWTSNAKRIMGKSYTGIYNEVATALRKLL